MSHFRFYEDQGRIWRIVALLIDCMQRREEALRSPAPLPAHDPLLVIRVASALGLLRGPGCTNNLCPGRFTTNGLRDLQKGDVLDEKYVPKDVVGLVSQHLLPSVLADAGLPPTSGDGLDFLLHRAIADGLPSHTILGIAEAALPVLSIQERDSKLVPFVLAATKEANQSLTTVYQLLRMRPVTAIEQNPLYKEFLS